MSNYSDQVPRGKFIADLKSKLVAFERNLKRFSPEGLSENHYIIANKIHVPEHDLVVLPDSFFCAFTVQESVFYRTGYVITWSTFHGITIKQVTLPVTELIAHEKQPFVSEAEFIYSNRAFIFI